MAREPKPIIGGDAPPERTVILQEAAKTWKSAREAAMKDPTPETFTELLKAESALLRAIT